jgi:hypothetical protein
MELVYLECCTQFAALAVLALYHDMGRRAHVLLAKIAIAPIRHVFQRLTHIRTNTHTHIYDSTNATGSPSLRAARPPKFLTYTQCIFLNLI